MAESQVEDNESDCHSDVDVDTEVIPTNEPPIPKTRVRKIEIDSKIKLSKKEMNAVKTEITPKVKIYGDDKLSCNVPAFPTDFALVKMASMAYNNYDKQPDLSDQGWEFLVAAWNDYGNNGYYGCAYFNEDYQQIVIAHRGTVIFNLNDWYNNWKGIYSTNFAAQMNSAVTFTEMILSMINEFNQKGAYLKLSFTGHSLGGWLAQVTTFSAKYLTKDEENNQFSLIEEPQTGYHAHTVAFDSPGCKSMLGKLKTRYIPKLYGDNIIEISVKSLDITTYLSAPNRVNCFHRHVGQLYRIFVNVLCSGLNENNKRWRVTNWAKRAAKWCIADDTKKRWRVTNFVLNSSKSVVNWGRKRFWYTIGTHEIKKIVGCFDPQTGLVKKDGEGRLEVQEVLNWPIIKGIIFTGSEYDEVVEWVAKFENYRPPEYQFRQVNGRGQIRYHTGDVDENSFKFSVFSEAECNFVEAYDIRRFFPKYESVIFSVDTDDSKNVLKSAIERLDSMKFGIDKDKHLRLLDPGFQPSEFISYVKLLNHFFPDLNREKRTTKCFRFELILEIYKTESFEYLKTFRENSLEFNEGSFNLSQFLDDVNSRVLLHFEEDTSVGVLKIYKVFELIKADSKYEKSLFLDVKTILKLQMHVNLASIVEQISEDYLIVIENNDNSEPARECLKEILAKVEKNLKIKLILFHKKNEVNCAGIVGRYEESHHEGFQLSDLSSDSQNEIFNRELINLQGHHVSLAQIIPSLKKSKSAELTPNSQLLRSIIRPEILMKLGNQEEIKAGSELDESEDCYIKRILTRYEKTVNLEYLRLNKDDIYVIGNYDAYFFSQDNHLSKIINVIGYKRWVHERHPFQWNMPFIILDVKEAENQFKNICEYYPNNNVHWLSSVDSDPSRCICKHEKSRLGPDGTGSTDWKLDWVEYEENDDHGFSRLPIDDVKDSIVTVVGLPGMGKSTFFTNLALHKKKLYPFQWIVKIKLTKIVSCKNLPQAKQHMDGKMVVECLAEILDLKSEFEKSLFEYCLHDEKVVLILDAFDEVSPKYDDQIFGLLDTLQIEMKVKQLWLSSRPYALKDEQPLGTVYILQGFDERDQMNFFLKFWGRKLKVNLDAESCFNYSISLIKFMTLYNTRESVVGIPLVLMVIAEYYQNEFETFCKSNKSLSTCSQMQQISLHALYEKVIENKTGLIYAEKLGLKTEQQSVDIESKKRHKTTVSEHKLLALVSCQLDSLAADQKIAINDLIHSINKGKEITGLVSSVDNGVPQFIHATFAEYFASVWLIEQMVETEDDGRLVKLFEGLGDLLLRDSNVVYSLVSSQLSDNRILKEKLTTCLQNNKHLVEILSKVSKNFLNIFCLLISLGVDNETLHSRSIEMIVEGVEMEEIDIVESFCCYKYGDVSDYVSIIQDNELLFRAAKTNFSGSTMSFLLSKISAEGLRDVVNAYNKNGETALHVAVRNNRLEVAKVLIENGADARLLDKYRYTALGVALLHQHCAVVELLLSIWCFKSPLDLVWKPKYEMIRDDEMSMVYMNFIQRCFEQESVDEPSPHQLGCVVSSPNHTLIKSLLSLGADEIGEIPYDLSSVLHAKSPVVDVSDVMKVASQYSGPQKLLIALIGNVALKYPKYLSRLFCCMNDKGQTLLHLAAKLNYVATAELMIGLGADTNIRNSSGETALSVAAKCLKYSFVLWLICKDGDEAIKKAFKSVYLINGFTDDDFLKFIYKYFIDENRFLTKTYDGGDTMLHIAAQLGLVKLIDRGGDVNVRNEDDHTPLSLACKNGHSLMTMLLIKKGASVNYDKQSTLLWAINGMHCETVELLFERGANVNARCSFALANNRCTSDFTPLQFIANMCHLNRKDREKEHIIDFAKILIFKGANITTCFDYFPFHMAYSYADLVVLFVKCGADIYATNSEGVSLVTYLEEHWKSVYLKEQKILRSVFLFSKCKPPEKLLTTIQKCDEDDKAKRDFKNAMKFEKIAKKKYPELFNLITACKAEDIINIHQHLPTVESYKLDYHDILFEYFNFFEVIISGLIKRDVCTFSNISKLEFHEKLSLLSKHCDEYLKKLGATATAVESGLWNQTVSTEAILWGQ